MLHEPRPAVTFKLYDYMIIQCFTLSYSARSIESWNSSMASNNHIITKGSVEEVVSESARVYKS